MRTTRTFAPALLVSALLASESSAATLLTSNTIPNATTIDFSLLSPDTFPAIGVLPGGITLTPVNDSDFYVIGDYGLGDNGTWSSFGGGPVSVGTAFGFQAFLRFAFPSPVAAVGGFVNYCVDQPGQCSGTAPIMRVLDSSFNVLAVFDLAALAPISTGQASVNDGAFRGIDMGANVISYFDWGGQFVVQRDLTYGVSAESAIPEPATLLLFATGIAGLGAARRRRSRKA